MIAPDQRGYGQTAITEIAKRAAVANRVFYANFKSKDDAFIYAFDMSIPSAPKFMWKHSTATLPELGQTGSRRIVVEAGVAAGRSGPDRTWARGRSGSG